MIRRLIGRFQKQGPVSDFPRSGRPRTIRTEENIERVQVGIQEEPGTSTRRRSGQLGVSRTSLRRILRRDIHLYS